MARRLLSVPSIEGCYDDPGRGALTAA